MKTIQILLALLFFSITVLANSKDSLSQKSTKKNEVGLILNPVGIVLLGAAPTGQRIGVTYKKGIKIPNVYLTSGAYYQGYSNNFNKMKELTLEVNGPLRNIQYNIENAHKVLLSFGAEQRWSISKCPAVTTYLGYELLFSYGIENTNIGSQWMKADTSKPVDYSMQTLEAVSDFKRTSQVSRANVGIGAQFNAGLQLHLNKRFYLFAQTSPAVMFSKVTSEEENLVSNTSKKYKSNQFDFDMRALVSDIGLTYKF